MSPGKVILGLTEDVTLFGRNGQKHAAAKVDTGASSSSLDKFLAQELGLGPVIGNKYIKQASGATMRPYVEAEIELHGKRMKAVFTLADRSKLKYDILIGVNILSQGFLVDPSKK
ncbi:TPA: hypothetical protein HA245_01690 [Candidatus Woesearchaeota archaeon]|nr:hypothetical protein [Candidatus Woesearchaeota archaeon]HIH49016.1 hypothetical protein [Candidatus Woesearchaeota archaeon]HIJ03021.1 hypothetical protein [Candidatus Woesearchaeota archaeon]